MKKRIREMFDKLKQLQKKPPDKRYEEMYILEIKIVKCLSTHVRLQLADSERKGTLQW
jgi:hypothetical protein